MRLIDADRLKKHIRRCDDSATRATFDYVDEDDIDDMPTVDVLDKIKAEIKEIIENIPHIRPFENFERVLYTKGFIDGLGSALDLIEKHKAESEKV